MEGPNLMPEPTGQSLSPEAEQKIEKETVLEMLRTHGLEDPETMALVMKWTEQLEASRDGSSRSTILNNIERADLYVAARDKDGAIECLEDARREAVQENEADLVVQIEAKIDELVSIKID
jgi:hypothetical protein